jgi:hypothetical protein
MKLLKVCEVSLRTFLLSDPLCCDPGKFTSRKKVAASVMNVPDHSGNALNRPENSGIPCDPDRIK